MFQTNILKIGSFMCYFWHNAVLYLIFFLQKRHIVSVYLTYVRYTVLYNVYCMYVVWLCRQWVCLYCTYKTLLLTLGFPKFQLGRMSIRDKSISTKTTKVFQGKIPRNVLFILLRHVTFIEECTPAELLRFFHTRVKQGREKILVFYNLYYTEKLIALKKFFEMIVAAKT